MASITRLFAASLLISSLFASSGCKSLLEDPEAFQNLVNLSERAATRAAEDVSKQLKIEDEQAKQQLIDTSRAIARDTLKAAQAMSAQEREAWKAELKRLLATSLTKAGETSGAIGTATGNPLLIALGALGILGGGLALKDKRKNGKKPV